MNKKIIISFSITIILLLLLGVMSVIKMMEVSDLTQKLYKHPYTVSNATKTIKINLISMHKSMQDILNSKDSVSMQVAVNDVNAYEKTIYQKFEIVFDRYLGDKKDIQTSYDAFVKSQALRDEVIHLMLVGEIDKARLITKEKGTVYIKALNSHVDKMIAYANNKAIFFKDDALEKKMSSIIFVILMLGIIMIIVITILVVLVKNIAKNEKKLQEHFHLIDQNIMSAKSNINCKIIDASSALYLHLGLSKKELLQTKEYFLLQDCSKELQEEIKRVISSGREWSGEISKLDSNGDIKWMSVHITPLLNENFEIVGYNNILLDISSKKEIEAISRVDGLTQVYNRRFFDELFPKKRKIAHRQNKLLSFLMIDIDFFKQYNDTYGHQVGDSALKKVALTLKESFKRPDDYVFRLGGEEFGALYMVQEKQSAINLANHVRESVESLQIEHSLSSVSKYLSISIGVYIIDLEDISLEEEIYARCDEALYKAKKEGRNRVILA